MRADTHQTTRRAVDTCPAGCWRHTLAGGGGASAPPHPQELGPGGIWVPAWRGAPFLLVRTTPEWLGRAEALGSLLIGSTPGAGGQEGCCW